MEPSEHTRTQGNTLRLRSDISQVPAQALHITRYSLQDCQVTTFLPAQAAQAAAEVAALKPGHDLVWLHCVGINDAATLRAILTPFGIHDLVLEDILNRKQRPKIENYGHYVFMAARVFQYQKNHKHNETRLSADQVYLIVGEGWLITLQSQPLGLFIPIQEHLQHNHANLRSQGLDFLTYTLLDRIIDDYFVVLEQYSARVESLDNQVFNTGTNNDVLLMSIHKLKRDAMRLRRALLPQREALHQLVRGDFPLFDSGAQMYLRDVYDHSQHLVESLDGARDMVISMMDVHLSYQSNRLNKQMRVLTAITIIFMPLTVLTGIYGMNFEHMPELKWPYGYYAVLGLMALIIVGLLAYFKRRRWL